MWLIMLRPPHSVDESRPHRGLVIKVMCTESSAVLDCSQMAGRQPTNLGSALDDAHARVKLATCIINFTFHLVHFHPLCCTRIFYILFLTLATGLLALDSYMP